MPLTLKTRIGSDTLGKLERAAARRYAEANRLLTDEPLGAIYLFGYTIEMRLKAAHYRLTSLPINADISVATPPNSSSPRKLAEGQIKIILGPAAPASVGHHLLGWANLVIDSRAVAGLPTIASQAVFLGHIQNAALCWTESLRYHANKPYNAEVQAMTDAARWVKSNYRRLWS
jgi:hypothetical protein